MNHKHYRRMLADSHNDHIEKAENASLEKTSKNVKEQKKKLFGVSGNPATKSNKGQAQMEALKDFAQRRYGVDIVPSKGKFDPKKGEYRKKNAKIGTDKPDWRGESGYEISSQSNSGAQSHELGHLEQMPVGRKAHEHQTIMDQEVGEAVKYGGGPTASFRHPSEVQARAAENPLRRRAGLPPHTPTADVSEGDPMRVVLGTQNEPAAVRYVDKKGKLVDQLKSGKLLSPENRQRMQDIDEGILRYDHKQGWAPSNDNNALINLRGQGRQEEAAQRLKQKYSNPNPQQDAIDLSSLSGDDHKAVQEFLAQRRGKLAASEDYDDLEKGIKLTHYSKQQGLNHLDPEYMGTGAPSEENKQGIPSVKQTSYYREGVEPESVVASGAKSRYTVEHPDESALYDIYEDPQGLVAESFKQQGRLDRDHMAQTLRDAGYHGFYTTHPHYAKQGVVNLFHKMPIAGEEKLDKAFSSKTQRRFAYANPEKFGGQKGIKEWESETPKNIPERMEKGAMRRLAPFSPSKVDTEEHLVPRLEHMYDWQDSEQKKSRRELDKLGMDQNARTRALHKLSAATPVRRSPDGKREFLLHRGMGQEEIDNSKGSVKYSSGKTKKIISHNHPSSWTPNIETALEFGHERDGTASAWINEDHISFVPKQYGSHAGLFRDNKNKNEFAEEHEVIVSPGHNSELVHKENVRNMLGREKDVDLKESPTNPDQAINLRSRIGASPSINRNISESLKERRSQKHQKVEKSEDDLKKGLRDKLKAIFSPKPQSQGNPNDPWLGINDQKPVYRRRYAHFQGTHGKPNLPKSEDLQKMSRGRLEFPKAKKVTSRPDQEIQNIDTPRQGEMFERKIGQSYMNYIDPHRSYKDWERKGTRQNILNQMKGGHLIPDNQASKTSEDFKEIKGYTITPQQVQSHGAVVRLGEGEKLKQHGRIQGEGLIPTGQRREHEAIHYLINDVGNKYGEKTKEHLVGKLNSLIHPQLKVMLQTHLSNVGYSPNTHGTEMIPHLYEMLHDPSTRDIMKQTSDLGRSPREEKYYMDAAKKSWNAIREFGKRFNPEEVE